MGPGSGPCASPAVHGLFRHGWGWVWTLFQVRGAASTAYSAGGLSGPAPEPAIWRYRTLHQIRPVSRPWGTTDQRARPAKGHDRLWCQTRDAQPRMKAAHSLWGWVRQTRIDHPLPRAGPPVNHDPCSALVIAGWRWQLPGRGQRVAEQPADNPHPCDLGIERRQHGLFRGDAAQPRCRLHHDSEIGLMLQRMVGDMQGKGMAQG